jgi:hypothetical protein
VEIQRLHTSIVDECKHFDAILAQCQQEDPENPIVGAVQELITRRTRVNSVIVAKLFRIYALEGFTGKKSIGIQKGQG